MAKILVVDDQPYNIEYLEEELHLLGHKIVTASDGDEALEKIKTTNPDLVLLDYSMPHKDGVEVLKILRADPAYETLPVIMVTALKGLEDRITGLEAGADDYITKPFHIGEAAARINSMLRLRNLQQQVARLSHIQAVGQTLVTLAHHINNATQAISGMAQLCQADSDNLPQHQLLAKISFTQSQKISAVIDILQNMVNRMELKTSDYAGEPDKMFDIESELQTRLKQIEDAAKD